MKFYGRQNEIQYLNEFVNTPKSGLIYVRGRRRVGKSLLLQYFKTKNTNCFYFSGTIDSSDEKIRRDFAEAWDQFAQGNSLMELNKSALTWSRIFKEITKRAVFKKEPLTLIFDEIQWIAKTGSGFIGKIKETWLEWEQTQSVKVVLCGSSSKFFDAHVGGEEKALRGLSTQATLWVYPFSLGEVQKYYLSSWSRKEICLAYMMLGGIPYYLERLNPELGFIHAINEAIFTSKGVFLQELDEILKLEFNEGGKINACQILAALEQDGKTQNAIIERTGLPQSTVSGLLDKLCDYQLIFEKHPVRTQYRWHQAGVRYTMKDFFMNFYFQILEPLKNKIQKNTSALLFPCEVLRFQKGFYIENFSGKAFELLAQSVLERRSLREGIFRKLSLHDPDYSVSTYWDEKTQIDLVVDHRLDRITRIIECKWTDASAGKNYKDWVSQLLQKECPLEKNFVRKSYLIVSEKATAPFRTLAHTNRVGLVELDDLF